MSWTQEAPTEPGNYWFYGDPWMGQMGQDYRDDRPPVKVKLYFVEVHRVGNGMMAHTEGQFVRLRKFDRKREGYLGYWLPVVLPELPKDQEAFL